jgi:hypothetical protein
MRCGGGSASAWEMRSATSSRTGTGSRRRPARYADSIAGMTLSSLPEGSEFLLRLRPIQPVHRGRPQETSHTVAKSRQLFGWYQLIGDAEQNDREAIVIWGALCHRSARREAGITGNGRLASRAEIPEYARQIVVTAKREDVQHMIPQRWASSRDD